MISSLDLGKKVIKDKIPLISRNPGVYRMISSTGEILYIGKAKNIPNRLKSYASDSNLPIRTERMLSLTHSLETTTTNNESEALLLEANLIKKHKPRFNILLRDDKSFPYIYIGNKDKWPQLTKLRGKKLKYFIVCERSEAPLQGVEGEALSYLLSTTKCYRYKEVPPDRVGFFFISCFL